MFLAVPGHGAQFEEEVSTNDYLFVKGIIHSVSSDDQTIVVKPKKGPTIAISVDENTLFDGFYNLAELKIRQPIKVWYRPEQEQNRALKILKPLDLGC
jgi:hypothetical protein